MSGFQIDSDGAEDKALKGATDGTLIGNVGDSLKTTDLDVLAAVGAITTGTGNGASNIIRRNEAIVTSRNETDLASTAYTVPDGKVFSIDSFSASYDSQAALYVRLKKQTGGAGAFSTVLRLNMMSGGHGNSSISTDLSKGFKIGVAGDVFKITYEASIIKGNIFAMFAGSEV